MLASQKVLSNVGYYCYGIKCKHRFIDVQYLSNTRGYSYGTFYSLYQFHNFVDAATQKHLFSLLILLQYNEQWVPTKWKVAKRNGTNQIVDFQFSLGTNIVTVGEKYIGSFYVVPDNRHGVRFITKHGWTRILNIGLCGK